MADHNDFGKMAEERAVVFLEEKGYRILARNWRFQKAEIDIIAKDQNDDVVVVEVKARKNEDFSKAEDAINKKKIQLLIKAANEFVTEYYTEKCNVRFDIMSLVLEGSELKITHTQNAFESIDAN